MYLNYWNLQRAPFDDRLQPELYFPAAGHQAALLKLRYLIDQRKGIGLLVGEHGLGKSLLTQVFERQSPGVAVVRLLLPQLSPLETLQYFVQRLGQATSPGDTPVDVIRQLEEGLAGLQQRQVHPVFVIDDAHLLEIGHLNSLRLLLNLHEAEAADFSIILCGRTQLLGRLPQLESLASRVALRAALTPLKQAEVYPYLQHRLSLCGGSPNLFTPGAAERAWQLSQGVFRKLHQLCDLALLVGMADQLGSLGPIEIDAAAEELAGVVAPNMAA